MESTQEQHRPSLEAVQIAFESFRKTKVSRGTPFPESLWKMARALTEHYERLQISRALKIGSKAYHRYVLQTPTTPPRKKHQRFIRLSIPAQTSIRPIAKIVLPNGITVDLLCPSTLTTLLTGSYAAINPTL